MLFLEKIGILFEDFENMKTKIIFFIGPPGSGKGTQAEILSGKFGFYHLETSKILESKIMDAKKGECIQIEGKTYFFDKEREKWKNGLILSPPFVAYLIKEKVRELAEDKRKIVFSGSPRSIYEAEELLDILLQFYLKDEMLVFNININVEESVKRNSKRRICQLVRHSILYNEETISLTKCPLDGSQLLKREGLDDPETIKKRFEEYEKQTFPVIDFFKNQGIRIEKINGSYSPVVVFENIISILEK